MLKLSLLRNSYFYIYYFQLNASFLFHTIELLSKFGKTSLGVVTKCWKWLLPKNFNYVVTVFSSMGILKECDLFLVFVWFYFTRKLRNEAPVSVKYRWYIWQRCGMSRVPLYLYFVSWPRGKFPLNGDTLRMYISLNGWNLKQDIPQQQTSLAPYWLNVDHVGSTLGQRGPNVPCYLGRHLPNQHVRVLTVCLASLGISYTSLTRATSVFVDISHTWPVHAVQ